jgi:hypothetical protein
MITVETHVISKLAGYIRISSMVEGQPRRILHYKESYTQASQINARNNTDLGILLELA